MAAQELVPLVCHNNAPGEAPESLFCTSFGDNSVALPPTPVDHADAFIRDVDDDFQREKLQSLWQRYGRTAVTLVSLILIALGGYFFLQSRKNARIDAEADRYMAALEKLDTNAGQATQSVTPLLAEIARNSTPGYRALAQLDLAALALRDKKTPEALTIYRTMAADANVPQAFRDYAQLRSIMLSYDTLKINEIITRLSPLAQESNPWFGTAGELLAVAHLRAGQPQVARPIFEALQRNETVPLSIRARAREMARMLGTPDAALKPLDEVS